MDDIVELLNVENVCRLCLSVEEPKSSIFGAQDSSAAVPLVTKIQACLSLQVRFIFITRSMIDEIDFTSANYNVRRCTLNEFSFSPLEVMSTASDIRNT